MQMRHYLPSNWHVATSITVAVWIIWAIWCNVPRTIDASSDYARLSANYTSATGNAVDPQFVHFNRAVGFPVHYRQHEILPNLTARLDYHSNRWLWINVVLCFIATASVAFALQSIRQFSIQHILYATALIAFAIVFYQYALPLLVAVVVSLSPRLHFFAYAGAWYIPMLYFLPLPLAIFLAWRESKPGVTTPCNGARLEAIAN